MPSKKKMETKLPPSAILQEIDAATMKEELALPIYADHIQSVLFWSGLPETKREKIRQSLAILLHDSQGHVRLLKHIKTFYKRETVKNKTTTSS